MADTIKQRGKLSLILLFCFLLGACSLENINGKIKNIDDSIGKELNKLQTGEQNDLGATDEKTEATEKNIADDSLKRKIDKWISENNLNRYGDAMDAVYAGGTPLFNESTGENIDRYDYILKNHPELISVLKNNQPEGK